MTPGKLKELTKNAVFSVFPDKTKIDDPQWENAGVSWTQGMRHVIYILFGSFLGKI